MGGDTSASRSSGHARTRGDARAHIRVNVCRNDTVCRRACGGRMDMSNGRSDMGSGAW